MTLIRLVGPRQRQFACQQVFAAPDGYIVRIGAETRRDAQNRLLWPMIEDLRRQVPEFAQFTKDDTKLRFLDALGSEMHFLPKLEGQGMFPVGLRSSTLTVEQFSGLIELLFVHGAKHGVEWTEPADRAANTATPDHVRGVGGKV